MAPSLRVALNLIYLVPGETGGMEVYARELLPRLAAIDGIEPLAIVNRVAAEARDAPWSTVVPSVTADVDARDRKQWVWGEQRYVPRIAAEHGAALIHSLASTGPGRWAGGPPRVTTVHDLHYAVAPDAHFGLRGLGMRILVPSAVRASRRIIADSQSTKDDVVRLIGTPDDEVDVVHLSTTLPPDSFVPTPEAELRARLRLGDRPVLLSLAAKRPHKNVEGLIDAIAAIPPDHRPVLVVPGYATEHEHVLLQQAVARNVSEHVRFPGWLSRADVEGLWRLCVAHVFPSFYEGFGLPVLEAMACGATVLTTRDGALSEVGGDAVAYTEPTADAIATSLGRLLEDEERRTALSVAAVARAATFTWDASARAHLAAFEAAVAAAR